MHLVGVEVSESGPEVVVVEDVACRSLVPGSRMPAVKNVGEPCAREPLALIDAAAGGNQRQAGSHSRAVWAPRADPTLIEVGSLSARHGLTGEHPRIERRDRWRS